MCNLESLIGLLFVRWDSNSALVDCKGNYLKLYDGQVHFLMFLLIVTHVQESKGDHIQLLIFLITGVLGFIHGRGNARKLQSLLLSVYY